MTDVPPELKAEREPKFRVGQKVRCIKNPYARRKERDRRGAGWSYGLEFTIEKITSSEDYVIYWPPSVGLGIYEEFLDIAGEWDSEENYG